MRHAFTAFALTLFLLLGVFSVHAAAQATPNGQCGHERIELAAAPGQCPCCGFSPVADILYGRAPAYEQSDREAGRVVLGGCVVGDDFPKWACTRCGKLFYPQKLP